MLTFKIKPFPVVITMCRISVACKQVQVFFGNPTEYKQQCHCY